MPEDIGPVLVQGPVEVVLPDGSVQLSERPVVALCMCRRSRRYPFCDTSHRRHSRPRADPSGASSDGKSSDDKGVDGRVGKRDEQ
ncbi:MAG TPA: CDGSH iron-sulfur domain-containing protein [Actinospica sp.]|jgi:CDGSH-type Zn-finger protein|nr:CDGSH iron-sulfur domain-containing protein [Actinospica sp.]